ncbi:MAG: M20/M25/M40 family metallo-hydrolase [archaeon]
MMKSISDIIDRNYGSVIIDLKKITLIPSPPFKEEKRISFLKNRLEALGYKDAEIDKVGNLRLTIKGKSPQILVFSAHVDTAFPKGTKLEIKEDKDTIACPGICDDAMGIAALLCLAGYIKENNIIPKNDTILLFNVGEEAPGNLRGIRHFFDSTPKDRIKAHICIEGHMSGRLTKKVVGSHRTDITLRGKGGHSWRDSDTPNTIVKASALIQHLASMNLPKDPKTTLNIGTIKGGTSVNSIPEEVTFSLEIRSLDQDIIETLKDDIASLISGMRKSGLAIETAILDERPAGEMKERWLIDLIKDIHTDLGIKTIDDIGSTDSNYPVSLGLPSVTIGITDAKGTHSKDEYLYKAPIRTGIKQLVMIFHALQEI